MTVEYEARYVFQNAEHFWIDLFKDEIKSFGQQVRLNLLIVVVDWQYVLNKSRVKPEYLLKPL